MVGGIRYDASKRMLSSLLVILVLGGFAVAVAAGTTDGGTNRGTGTGLAGLVTHYTTNDRTSRRTDSSIAHGSSVVGVFATGQKPSGTTEKNEERGI